MNIQVMYNDNSVNQIDSKSLDDMLSDHRIKKFMRSDGWNTVGEVHIRGEGGMYEGVDRRGLYGLTGELNYKIAA